MIPVVSSWRSLRIMLRWRYQQLRTELPQLAVAQVLFATGTAIGLGLLIPDVDPVQGAYLATGAFLINLLIVALVALPSVMTEMRVSGSLDYVWALPFPRVVYLVVELIVWGGAALPGMVVSLVLTSLRFDFALDVSPLVVPVLALSVVTAASVGAAIGLRSSSMQLTNLFGNFVVIVILLFAPVNFPAERLPAWLQAVHSVLPVAPMAELVRATLVAGLPADVARSLGVLGSWAVAGSVVTWRAVRR